MKRVLILAVVTGFSFLLTGCPYETEVPIDNPTVKFPERLFGKWQPKNSDDELITIQKKDDYVVRIIKATTDSGGINTSDEYEAFISDIKGVQFLNLAEVNETRPSLKYYLYKMEVSANSTQITLSAVTENIDEKFSSSAGLKMFIEKNMHLSFFFNKEDEVYIRLNK